MPGAFRVVQALLWIGDGSAGIKGRLFEAFPLPGLGGSGWGKRTCWRTGDDALATDLAKYPVADPAAHGLNHRMPFDFGHRVTT